MKTADLVSQLIVTVFFIPRRPGPDLITVG